MAQHTGSAPTAGKWQPPVPEYFIVRFQLWSWQLPAHLCAHLSLRLQPPLGPCELLHSLKEKKASIFSAFKQPGLLTHIRYACDNLEADAKLASKGRPKFALPSAVRGDSIAHHLQQHSVFNHHKLLSSHHFSFLLELYSLVILFLHV